MKMTIVLNKQENHADEILSGVINGTEQAAREHTIDRHLAMFKQDGEELDREEAEEMVDEMYHFESTEIKNLKRKGKST